MLLPVVGVEVSHRTFAIAKILCTQIGELMGERWGCRRCGETDRNKTEGDYSWSRHSLRIHPSNHDDETVARCAEGVKIDWICGRLHLCAITRLDLSDRTEPKKIFLLIARIADFLTLVEESQPECADELVNLFCNNY